MARSQTQNQRGCSAYVVMQFHHVIKQFVFLMLIFLPKKPFKRDLPYVTTPASVLHDWQAPLLLYLCRLIWLRRFRLNKFLPPISSTLWVQLPLLLVISCLLYEVSLRFPLWVKLTLQQFTRADQLTFIKPITYLKVVIWLINILNKGFHAFIWALQALPLFQLIIWHSCLPSMLLFITIMLNFTLLAHLILIASFHSYFFMQWGLWFT